jgi:CRISPR-associated endonuclease/helicase Cas3
MGSPALAFFESNYPRLRVADGRPQTPMKWMGRLFENIVADRHPRLMDLLTGAGKTELVVIWLLGLAWYGKGGALSSAVPRRLVWVVNRRVLVQQVFELARELRQKLTSDSELEEVRAGLRNLSGADESLFEFVELRGQIVADRDWAIRPAMPHLIIGTVDQIGSRLLFQGYGLGKWGRAQQAGLLGVDAWVAVDEAHLVPAFVLTLRQLRERCASSAENLPCPFNAIFARLPFWLTELSATPGLPAPSADKPFRLTKEEENDLAIADRILASTKKQGRLNLLPKGDKPKDILVEKLVAVAVKSKAERIAIFVREVGVADNVARKIIAALKSEGLAEPGRFICKITGRIRGYERDRLVHDVKAFQVFRAARPEPPAETVAERYFLIGTAAAEVGLDADTDTILCDFAPLPTLLQRLGRLDRRGVLSRRHVNRNAEAPTMTIFTWPDEATEKVRKQISSLAIALASDDEPYSAELMAATRWQAVLEAKGDKDAGQAKEEKSTKDPTKPLIDAATWRVLDPNDERCKPPKSWLAHESACITAGPVVMPPLTDAVLDYWSATTDPRSSYLSPHPFLYGLPEDDENTPLVGVAFRLEVEALSDSADEDEDTEAPTAAVEVEEIFKRFPPLRAELHWIRLSVVREWLTSAEAEAHPFVYRDGDKWRAKPAREPTATAAAAVGPNSTLILPATVAMLAVCNKLLNEVQEDGGKHSKHTAISDVLDGVTRGRKARYFRTIESSLGSRAHEGAWIWDFESEEVGPLQGVVPEAYDRRPFSKELCIAGETCKFRYYRPARQKSELQYLDDQGGKSGHHSLATQVAVRVAEAIAPGDSFLASLLSEAARMHDEGKRYPKWQRAFGWRVGMDAIAKLHPDLKKPGSLKGFRHEWESLRKLAAAEPDAAPDIPKDQQQLWCDLLLHLVGVHHGHLRPSITDAGLTPDAETALHNPLRLEAAERFIRLQRQLGRWRLAYLEALLKTADAEGSRNAPEEDEEDGD